MVVVPPSPELGLGAVDAPVPVRGLGDAVGLLRKLGL